MGAQASTDQVPQPFALPPRVDERLRARRLAAPLATAVVTCAGLGYLAAVDPNEPGHYPLCPTQALLGVDCPGCGMLRGTHSLLTGDVPGALDHNVLLVAVIPLALVLWVRWSRYAWRGRVPGVTPESFRRRNAGVIVSLVVLLAFGVVRNFVPFLGSGIG